jgi:hypothetical protein
MRRRPASSRARRRPRFPRCARGARARAGREGPLAPALARGRRWPLAPRPRCGPCRRRPPRPPCAAPRQCLWSLTELAVAGSLPPLLSPGGAEWQRLAEGFVAGARTTGADHQTQSFFKQALDKLSGAGGGGGGGSRGEAFISRQLVARLKGELAGVDTTVRRGPQG